MSFVDVRLHVSVRPTLEYTLPEVSRAVKSCLFADVTVARTLPVLESCVFPGACRVGETEQEEDDPNVVPLRRCMVETLSLVHDYLVELAALWKEHLSTARSHVDRVVKTFDHERSSAEKVRVRYQCADQRLVHDEFSREIERISMHLEASLQRIRDADEPRSCRPPELTAASAELRKLFANSYGVVPTQKLLRVKADFEGELTRTQAAVSSDFVAFCTRLLVPR